MNGWQTTLGGILYVLGSVSQLTPGLPPWVIPAGQVLQGIAVGYLGYHAAVQKPATSG